MIARSCFALTLVVFSGLVMAQLRPATQPGEFDALHSQAVSKNPSDLWFLITTDGNRKQFHFGETITLSMQFSSSSPGKYRVWSQLGRLTQATIKDVVHIDPPDGIADPLAGFPTRLRLALPENPFRRIETIQTCSIELNDWARLDKPGKYRIYIDAPRLIGPDVPDWLPTNGLIFPRMTVSSNILELEILPPDVLWSSVQLAAAEKKLSTSESKRDQRLAAVNVLKNLQTEEAARLLLTQVALPSDSADAISVSFQARQALYASRYRSLVIEGLQQLCANPKTAPPVANRLLDELKPPVSNEGISFEDQHDQAIARNPPGVGLDITSGRKQFRMGETIQLSMQFSSLARGKYLTWRPVGRLNGARESPVVSPREGTADPFVGYRFGAFRGLGSGNTRPLEQESAYVMELNEFVRFDKPAKYRLFINSRRLMDTKDQSERITVASNILELEILPPDENWIKSQIASASDIFSDPRSTSALQRVAIDTVKNLQTEEAAQLLLRQFGNVNASGLSNQYLIPALYSSRHRALVIEGLQKVCADLKNAPEPAAQLLIRINSVSGTDR